MIVSKSAQWTILLQIGAFLGYISFGWIADRIGRRPAFTLFMIGSAALVPLFAFYARTPATLLTLGPLVGFFVHGYFSLFGAMLAELFPTRIRGSVASSNPIRRSISSMSIAFAQTARHWAKTSPSVLLHTVCAQCRSLI